MNYEKIHETIIKTASSRLYDSSIYQNHHIIPLHENANSTEVVPLTIKEHRVIHFIRYKMGYGIGNYKAYLLLKGMPSVRAHQLIASKAGKIGGKILRENKLGIFSDDWDRSAETSRRHNEGIIFVDSVVAKQLGNSSVKSKKGIHSGNWDFSKQSKKNWENGVYQNIIDDLKSGKLGREYGHIGGRTCVDQQIGIHNKQNRKEYASLGGKVSGKLPHWTNGVENKKSNECPGDGWYRGRTLKKYKMRGN